MNQSSVIFGALFVGFLIYVTIRGRLPAYAGLFYQKGAQSGASESASSNPNLAPGYMGIPGLQMTPQQTPGILPDTPLLLPGYGGQLHA